ncbi:MAG: cell division ATPase MinD [Candidatus Aenigmatarchaeota archaeon]|nr:MAG: cell division ATPase MinD [Candidatus Aenigmarchaeota archaeon]
MGRIIAVSGGKGGVGKTTTVANLGLALRKLGKDVTLVDTNLTTPSLSLHLGIPLYPVTLHDVLRGDAYLTEAMYIHQSGMRIVPASLSLEDLEGTDAKRVSKALQDATADTDIVLLDCAAGLGNETIAALKAADDLLIVTNPDLPSVTDALKTKKLAEELGVKTLGVVLNRVDAKKKHAQLSEREVKEMLETPILARVPEDVGVQEAIHKKSPVVNHRPSAPSSREFVRLAASLTGEQYTNGHSGFFEKFKTWMMGFS